MAASRPSQLLYSPHHHHRMPIAEPDPRFPISRSPEPRIPTPRPSSPVLFIHRKTTLPYPSLGDLLSRSPAQAYSIGLRCLLSLSTLGPTYQGRKPKKQLHKRVIHRRLSLSPCFLQWDPPASRIDFSIPSGLAQADRRKKMLSIQARPPACPYTRVRQSARETICLFFFWRSELSADPIPGPCFGLKFQTIH